MGEALFIFSATAVATEATGFRPGARHALMLYGKAAAIACARYVAVRGAEKRGWSFVEIKRERDLDPDLAAIGDDTLRSAAQRAFSSGHSIIVYQDELPLDA